MSTESTVEATPRDTRETDAVIVFNISEWTDEELQDAALFWRINTRELAKVWGEMKQRQWQRELNAALKQE